MLSMRKMQIALVPIQRIIKFNVGPCGTYESELDFALKHFNLVPSFPGYEIAQRLIFLWCFYSVFRFSFFLVLAFFTIAIVKQPHYKRISLHLHPVLHPITLCYIRSAVVLLGLPAYAFSLFTILGLSTIAISDSILAKDVTLDCSKACICFVHWSRHIYFTSWLDNIDEFRCSTAEIACITTMFWPCQLFFVKCMRQTGYSMGVTVRLESALDLVKKMERAKERHWRVPREESILKKFPKPSR
jgi:hypothetical protein